MSLKRVLAAQTVLFLALIFVACACIVARLVSPSDREAFAGVGWPEITDGAFTKDVDNEVVAALPIAVGLDGLQAGVEYRVFDDAGPQVRAGCFGWLFLGEEVWEVKDGEHNVALHLAIANRIAADFARRRVQIVMLTVPDKARIARAELCSQAVSPQARDRLAVWTRLATGLPVRKVDIVRGWPGKPGYWRTDTHWDRDGAHFAATRTAAVVDEILRGHGAERATVTDAKAPQPRPGDLMHLANLEHAPSNLRPPPDMDRAETVSWQRSGGLLDSGPAPEVVLSGSSYSKNSGFSDALGLALGREVVQMSEDGGGFDGAVFALMNKHASILAHAKVVVWEFPERSLTQPLNAAEQAYLGAPP